MFILNLLICSYFSNAAVVTLLPLYGEYKVLYCLHSASNRKTIYFRCHFEDISWTFIY